MPEGIQRESEEKLEFLKREEIRTMAKDIARLQELEAKKEREKISAIKPEEKLKRVPAPAPPPSVPPLKKIPPAISPPGILIPKPLPKKPGPLKKILVRGVIIVLSFLLIGFFYWSFGVKKPPTEVLPPEEITPPPEEIIEKPEIIILPSLISVVKTETPEISKLEEIPATFEKLMKEEIPEGSLIRISIKNLEENRLVTLEDFSEVFQIEVPAEIYQKLEEDFTLAIFSQKEGRRIVLVAKIKDEAGLNELLKNWEKKIEKEGIFVAGKKIPSLSLKFGTAKLEEVPFRYLTISKADLGICYTLFEGHFILTASFQSMKKIIGELKTLALEEKVGQLFIVGIEGKTLTSELENFFKKYKPSGVLLLSKNIESESQLKKLISDLQNLSKKETGFPLFIAIDQEGGEISRVGFLTEKTPQSEIKNIEEAYQIGLKRGQELKELGINLNLAPLLDFTQEGDFLFSRSFQKSPLEIGNFGKALVAGQKAAGILTAIKHFPGYSGITFNPEEELAIVESIPEISQFKKAVEANPEMVMTSNLIYKEIDSALPFTSSPKATHFLKNNLGQEILIISDDLDQNSLLNPPPKILVGGLKEIVKKPIEAGVDLLIFSGFRLPVEQGLDAFFEAVRNGEISQGKIETSISRVINLKQKTLK